MGAKPEKRNDGLWYVGEAGFLTEESAAAYQNALTSNRKKTLAAAIPILITLVVIVAGWWRLDRPADAQRVGREFATMQQCLEFIADEMGESLQAQKNTPVDVSGKSVVSERFFRCELRETGTRGSVIEGRWDKVKK